GKPSAEEIAARKAAKQKKGPAADEPASEEAQQPAPTPRLVEKYRNQIVPALQQKFGYKNLMAVPRLEKVVISMGLGRFAVAGGEGKASFEKAEKELAIIAGQKPVRCRAKKSVANFKVRE